MIANYLEDARSRLRVYRMDGSLRGEIRLPGLGTVTGFPDCAEGKRDISSRTRIT